MRRLHKWFGLGSTALVLVTVITGLLWAYAPHLYWEDGYLEKKRPDAPASLAGITLTPQDAIRLAREQIGTEAAVTSVTLRSDFGTALYEVAGQRDSKQLPVLIDARAGKVLSPLAPELATRIARQYVRGEPPVESVRLLDQFVHRSGKVHESVYQVRFRQERNPEILIAASSGRIIEEQDDGRRFHFWVMRLHQLNFFGFKKTLTIMPGVALLLLVVSGVALGIRPRFLALRPTRSQETNRLANDRVLALRPEQGKPLIDLGT